MIPGEYFLRKEEIIANKGRRTIEIKVVNTGDRPVQIGSHCHFFEVNRQMAFDRAAAFGMRLNVPSGNAVRFEPGEVKVVSLVELGGAKRLVGGRRVPDVGRDEVVGDRIPQLVQIGKSRRSNGSTAQGVTSPCARSVPVASSIATQ